MKQFCALGVVLVFLGFVAQGERRDAAKAARESTSSGAADGASSPALTGERHPLYRVHKSDVLEVNFAFTPEFNQTLTVQPDGYIALREIPQLYVERLTLPELQEAIEKAYSDLLHEPEVTITLKDFDKPYFVASGEVGRPGKYELRAETTVTEALAIAGGMNEQAKHSQVVLFRRISNGLAETRVLDIKRMLKSRDLTEDVYLKPGDLLYVPQNTISKLRRYLPVSSLAAYWNPTQF